MFFAASQKPQCTHAQGKGPRLRWIIALCVCAALWMPLAVGAVVHAEEDVSGPAPTGDPPPEPPSYRTSGYRQPVPLTLKGARVLSSSEAMKLWAQETAIFIDVYPHPPKPAGLPAGTIWRDPSHMTIEDAVWLANVGYGVLSAEASGYFQRNLEMLTQGDKAKPLVFFCLKNCWMSWNAAKRALSLGYTNVAWYRDGTDGWQEAGGLVVEARPLP